MFLQLPKQEKKKEKPLYLITWICTAISIGIFDQMSLMEKTSKTWTVVFETERILGCN